MLKIKKSTILVLTVLFCGTSAFAQTEEKVSDKELKQFASAVKEIQEINQKTQMAMIGAVEAEDLAVERFNEIFAARQNPNKEVNATEEEMEKFNKANSEVVKLQKESQEQMEEEILKQELTLDRYQEITMIIQNDEEVMEKLQKIPDDER
ncbi:MAG: DUF4168 domain-containing protein [Bacteroidota bacterium]|nr:DUF4168 domain-containing protein [Bacteroidota bacterium]